MRCPTRLFLPDIGSLTQVLMGTTSSSGSPWTGKLLSAGDCVILVAEEVAAGPADGTVDVEEEERERISATVLLL